MAERPKAAVLKTVGRLRAPWVRILLPPPISYRDLIGQRSEIIFFLNPNKHNANRSLHTRREKANTADNRNKALIEGVT